MHSKARLRHIEEGEEKRTRGKSEGDSCALQHSDVMSCASETSGWNIEGPMRVIPHHLAWTRSEGEGVSMNKTRNRNYIQINDT